MSPRPDGLRILVTGGAGFLGSHLCERLLGAGHEVVCLDNLSTGSKRNVAHLLGDPRFDFVRHDVCEPFRAEVDAIYNLACPASPVHYQTDPIQTTKTCVMGTLNALGLARRTGARLLQASTSEIYGDPEVHPQPESYPGRVNPIGPRTCYDEGKRCAETLCIDYRRRHGLDVKIARIFNTYGPRMDHGDGRVVSNFVVQALRGEALTLYGTGRQTRAFCYVDDMIDGLMRMMGSEAGFAGPINLGNPEETSMRVLAEMVLDLTRSGARIARAPLPADDPRRRRPDISLARTALGWEPKVGLAEGLARTVAWFRERLDLTEEARCAYPS